MSTQLFKEYKKKLDDVLSGRVDPDNNLKVGDIVSLTPSVFYTNSSHKYFWIVTKMEQHLVRDLPVYDPYRKQYPLDTPWPTEITLRRVGGENAVPMLHSKKKRVALSIQCIVITPQEIDDLYKQIIDQAEQLKSNLLYLYNNIQSGDIKP